MHARRRSALGGQAPRERERERARGGVCGFRPQYITPHAAHLRRYISYDRNGKLKPINDCVPCSDAPRRSRRSAELYRRVAGCESCRHGKEEGQRYCCTSQRRTELQSRTDIQRRRSGRSRQVKRCQPSAASLHAAHDLCRPVIPHAAPLPRQGCGDYEHVAGGGRGVGGGVGHKGESGHSTTNAGEGSIASDLPSDCGGAEGGAQARAQVSRVAADCHARLLLSTAAA